MSGGMNENADPTWVQVRIEGQESRYIAIDPAPGYVFALKNAVKDMMAPDLGYCAVDRLRVYQPGTDVPPLGDVEALAPNAAVPSDTTLEEPLIVVAPPPPMVS